MIDKDLMELKQELKANGKTLREIKLYIGVEIQLIKQLLNETRRTGSHQLTGTKEEE